jgi:glycosyltransferase involved in cell wall biosynthesis
VDTVPKQQMKIVHIITRLVLGGAQENTLITCRLLAQRGHEVWLITGPAIGPEGELFEQTKQAPFETIVVDEMIRAIHPVKDLAAYLKIQKILKGIQPDIVHTHSAKAGVLGRYAASKLRSTHYALRNTIIVHSIHGLSFHPYQNNLLNKFYIMAERAAAKKTDYFISVADAMTIQSKAAGIGLDKPYITAYSAVDEDAFLSPVPDATRLQFRENYGIKKDSIVLITIARLFMLKGHDYIIESAKELAPRFENVQWLFVGNGNLSEKYKKQVAELGLSDRIKFTGLLPPSQIPLAIQSSDILVHCSLREGLARTLPQALLCGKPVISFDVDGAKEVVNENTGRLIEPKNINHLIDSCVELIQDEGLRKRIGQAGRESVKEKFSPKRMVDIIEEVYLKITKEKT